MEECEEVLSVARGDLCWAGQGRPRRTEGLLEGGGWTGKMVWVCTWILGRITLFRLVIQNLWVLLVFQMRATV